MKVYIVLFRPYATLMSECPVQIPKVFEKREDAATYLEECGAVDTVDNVWEVPDISQVCYYLLEGEVE